jgi:TLC ATP/ADP transporter
MTAPGTLTLPPPCSDASLDEGMQHRHPSPAGSRVSSGAALSASASSSSSSSVSSRSLDDDAVTVPPAKKKLSVVEAFSFLAASKQVRCLALMALAQGISTNLLEVSPICTVRSALPPQS